MMTQNKNDSGKAVELRSEEVQEVMNRIPSAIVRWGMTVMAVVVIGLLVASAYIRWPQTIECPFEWIPSENNTVITATLTPDALTHMSSHKVIEATLYSPTFPAEYSENGVSVVITDYTVVNNREDSYIVHLKIDLPYKIIKEDSELKILGNLLIITSDNTWLEYLINRNTIVR